MIAMPSSYPVTSHTDFVDQGSVFFALQGFFSHGLCYVKEAVIKGATTVVFDKNLEIPLDLFKWLKDRSIKSIHIENPRRFFAQMAADAAGNPAQKLKIFGITGTQGKTTSVHLLAAVFKKAGYKTAFLSSVYNSIDGAILPAPLTTPQPDYIHQFLKLCVDHAITHVVIEVAAQALTLHRVDGIQFDGIIMTNFAREHLEFYNSMDDYLAAKIKILSYQKESCIVLCNRDDPSFVNFASQYYGFSCIDKNAPLFGYQVVDNLNGLTGKISINDKEIPITSNYFYGYYNFYNILGVVGLTYFLGISVECIQEAISTFSGLPGRCERYQLHNNVTCLIDIAHNPCAFQVFLSGIRKMTSQLIVVFGAGGDRDRGRRPLLGEIVSLYADCIVLTNDNPRSEDPEVIVQEILVGISEQKKLDVIVLLDRKEAILYALSKAMPGAIVALLGKGSQRYQVFHDRKEFFSEIEIVNEYDHNLTNSTS